MKRYPTPLVTLAVLLLVALVALLLIGAANAEQPHPKPTDRETVWSAYLAEQKHGQAEYRLPDRSRVDILTDSTAYEVEWATKWEESVGQSLFYAVSTNRKPGIILLVHGSEPKDHADRERCEKVVEHLRKHGIKLTLEIVDVEGN